MTYAPRFGLYYCLNCLRLFHIDEMDKYHICEECKKKLDIKENEEVNIELSKEDMQAITILIDDIKSREIGKEEVL